MNKFYIVSVFLLLSSGMIAQDYDLFQRKKDDNFKIPDIYKNLTLEEYQLLSRNIRMMDMSYAVFVPGYVHFKAKENKRGYQILGARLLGYAGLTAYYSRRKNDGKQTLDYINGKDDNIDVTDKTLFISSLSLIASSYLYDWIHGKYMLEKKQENIKYKYGIKFKMEKDLSFKPKNDFPSISVTLSF